MIPATEFELECVWKEAYAQACVEMGLPMPAFPIYERRELTAQEKIDREARLERGKARYS